MKQAVVYLHGKGGNAEEAAHYRPLFTQHDVIGFDYQAQTPWQAREEFPAFFDRLCGRYESVSLLANSIGAYFAMHALHGRPIKRAWFISPIVDMQQLITDMMAWAGVSGQELCARGVIETTFGETLSWEYLCYVRENPIVWQVPTRILYGENDHLTSRETISAFAGRTGAELTVLQGGEHWFHTDAQMEFLDRWIAASL